EEPYNNISFQQFQENLLDFWESTTDTADKQTQNLHISTPILFNSDSEKNEIEFNENNSNFDENENNSDFEKNENNQLLEDDIDESIIEEEN
ncbi:22328_t:CDS:2, partial [Dentiscutata erythropus]